MRSRFGRPLVTAIVLLCTAVPRLQARELPREGIVGYSWSQPAVSDRFSAGIPVGFDQFSSGADAPAYEFHPSFYRRLYGSHFHRPASAHIGDKFDESDDGPPPPIKLRLPVRHGYPTPIKLKRMSRPLPAATTGFIYDEPPVVGDPFTGWYQAGRKSKDNIRVKYFINALLSAEKLRLGSFQAQLTFTRLARLAPTRDERLYCLLKACRNDLECTRRAMYFIPEMTSYNMRFLAQDFEEGGWRGTALTLRQRMKPMTECID